MKNISSLITSYETIFHNAQLTSINKY